MTNDSITAIDILSPIAESSKIFPIRMDKKFKDFLEAVAKENNIIGFEWTKGEWEFTVLVE